MTTCLLIHSKDCNRILLPELIIGLGEIVDGKHRRPIYITSENIPYTKSEGIAVTTGDGLWSTRLRIALKMVDEEFDNIVFFLEDMLPKRIDYVKFNTIIDWHVKNANDATKLGIHPFFNLKSREEKVAGLDVYEQIDQPYRISHQPVCIFKREFLEATIQEDISPWEHECRINDQLTAGKFGNRKIFCVGKVGKNYAPGELQGDVIEYHHALSRGQRVPFLG